MCGICLSTEGVFSLTFFDKMKRVIGDAYSAQTTVIPIVSMATIVM